MICGDVGDTEKFRKECTPINHVVFDMNRTVDTVLSGSPRGNVVGAVQDVPPLYVASSFPSAVIANPLPSHILLVTMGCTGGYDDSRIHVIETRSVGMFTTLNRALPTT
jgi:hypothetical protein